MRINRKTIPAVTALVLLAVPTWAADATQKSCGTNIIADLLPILIIPVLLYFFLRRTNRRNGPYLDRAMVHMERLEKQNDEIIGLLKDIAGKKQ